MKMKIENENNNGINENKKKTKKNLMPKTQLRVIKVPGFCVDFVCKKNTLKIIKQVNENYKEIQFLLDIVHYLKSQNEIDILYIIFLIGRPGNGKKIQSNLITDLLKNYEVVHIIH